MRRAEPTLAGGEGHPLKLVDGVDDESEPERIGLAAEGDLPHIVLDMPFGARTFAEKDRVIDAIALRRHALALEHDRSFEDHYGLVEIVKPVELAPGAGPDQGLGRTVPAGPEHVRAGFRIAFNDPGWLDWRRLEINVAMASFNTQKRHCHLRRVCGRRRHVPTPRSSAACG